jgi:hypothetical protein
MRCKLPGQQLPAPDGEGPGQMRFGAGRKGSDLLVPDMQPLDLAVLADGISESIQTVHDNTVDALDTDLDEDFGELFGNAGYGIFHLI